MSALDSLIQHGEVVRDGLGVGEIRKFDQPLAGLREDVDVGNQIDIRLAVAQSFDDGLQFVDLRLKLALLFRSELDRRCASAAAPSAAPSAATARGRGPEVAARITAAGKALRRRSRARGFRNLEFSSDHFPPGARLCAAP